MPSFRPRGQRSSRTTRERTNPSKISSNASYPCRESLPIPNEGLNGQGAQDGALVAFEG